MCASTGFPGIQGDWTRGSGAGLPAWAASPPCPLTPRYPGTVLTRPGVVSLLVCLPQSYGTLQGQGVHLTDISASRGLVQGLAHSRCLMRFAESVLNALPKGLLKEVPSTA